MLFKRLFWQNRNSGNSFLHIPVWFITINLLAFRREHQGQFLLGHRMPANFQLKTNEQTTQFALVWQNILLQKSQLWITTSIVWIILVHMTRFTVIDSFSTKYLEALELESHHFQGKHRKKSEGENFFIILEHSLLPISLPEISIHPHLMSPMI